MKLLWSQGKIWNLHFRECVEKIPDGSECVTGCGYMCASGFCRERFPTWFILYYLPLAIGKILNIAKWWYIDIDIKIHSSVQSMSMEYVVQHKMKHRSCCPKIELAGYCVIN